MAKGSPGTERAAGPSFQVTLISARAFPRAVALVLQPSERCPRQVNQFEDDVLYRNPGLTLGVPHVVDQKASR